MWSYSSHAGEDTSTSYGKWQVNIHSLWCFTLEKNGEINWKTALNPCQVFTYLKLNISIPLEVKKTKKKHDLSFLIDCQSCASAQSFYGRWIGNFTVFMKLMPLLDGWWKLRLMKVTYSTRAFSFLRCCTRSLPYYNTI